MEYSYKNPIIFLVGGKAKHGKDTFGGYLKQEFENNNSKVIVTQLAKYIKYYAREVSGWNLSEEDKPRALLLELGTSLIRQKLKKDDLFINRMIDDIDIFSYIYDVIIISDVRLKKEFDIINDHYPNAIKIIVRRPDFDNGLTNEQKNHPTEIDLDDYEDYNELIINTTLDSLKNDARKVYLKYRR